jgi:F-type H+-transporting ATPase subunit delta
MAENVTLARPYAEAVFALAKEAGTLDAWAQVLARLAAVAEDPLVRDFLSSPRVTAAQMVQLLRETAELSIDSEQANFVQVLIENDRAQFLPEISELFNGFKSTHDGVKEALVVSAFPFDAAALARLSADIEAHFKSKVHVTVQIDPELIGGVRIAVGDEVIDASVRGKLATMAAALQN